VIVTEPAFSQYAVTLNLVVTFFRKHFPGYEALFTSDFFSKESCTTKVHSREETLRVLQQLQRLSTSHYFSGVGRSQSSAAADRGPALSLPHLSGSTKLLDLSILVSLLLLGKSHLTVGAYRKQLFSEGASAQHMPHKTIGPMQLARLRAALNAYNDRYGDDEIRIVLPENNSSPTIGTVNKRHAFGEESARLFIQRQPQPCRERLEAILTKSGNQNSHNTLLCPNASLVQVPDANTGALRNSLILFTHRDTPPISLLVHLLDIIIPYEALPYFAAQQLPDTVRISVPSAPPCRLIASHRVRLIFDPSRPHKLWARATKGERMQLPWVLAEHICRRNGLPLTPTAYDLFLRIPFDPLDKLYGLSPDDTVEVHRVLIVYPDKENSPFSTLQFSSDDTFRKQFNQALATFAPRDQSALTQRLVREPSWTKIEQSTFRRLYLPYFMMQDPGTPGSVWDNDPEYRAAACFITTGKQIPSQPVAIHSPVPVGAVWTLTFTRNVVSIQYDGRQIAIDIDDPKYAALIEIRKQLDSCKKEDKHE
jgi:hypothetical protein